MTNNVAGLLPLLVFFAAVAASWPATLAAFGLGRWLGFDRALRAVAAGVAALGALGSVAVGVLAGPEVGLVLLGTLVAGALLLAVLPVVVGRAVLARRGVGPSRALRLAVAGWPLSMTVAGALFVAPGGTRYNVTFLDGVALYAALAAIAAVVLLGPAVVGLLAARVVRRRGPDAGTTP